MFTYKYSLFTDLSIRTNELEANKATAFDHEIHLLTVITTTFLFLLVAFIFILIWRRRSNNRDVEHGSGCGIEPDITARTDREKMQLITRISNFNANILDHLVFRYGDNLPIVVANHSPGSQGSGNLPNFTTRQPSNMTSTTSVAYSSNNSSGTNKVTSADDADSEPDYAEPIFLTSGRSPTVNKVTFVSSNNTIASRETLPTTAGSLSSPDRRPPLPSSAPPSAKPPPRHSSLGGNYQRGGEQFPLVWR